MRSEYSLISLIILSLVLSPLVVQIGMPIETSQGMITDRHVHQTAQYTSHGPINIESDADFVSQGWSGSGSENDPYVIEGLSIIEEYTTTIRIFDVTSYFVIKDCQLSHTGDGFGLGFGYGVHLGNVIHGIVRNCVFEGGNDAVYLYRSSGVTVQNNTMTYTDGSGVFAYRSDDCTIFNNIIDAPWSFGNGVELESCDNFLITGNEMIQCENGIEISDTTNCVIRNNTITNCQEYGVYVLYEDAIIEDNILQSNLYGIFVGYPNCTINDNTLLYNGIYFWTAWNHNMMGNTINGKPLGYIQRASDLTIDASEYGQLVLSECEWTTVENGWFTEVGLLLEDCIECEVVNCTSFYVTNAGIELYWSADCIISQCTVISSMGNPWATRTGIDIAGCIDCVVEECNIAGTERGVSFYYSERCSIINNSLHHIDYSGIQLFSCNETVVTQNRIWRNDRGIKTEYCWDDQIYENKVGWNEEANAFSDDSDNEWDDGVSVGNEWSDYSGDGSYVIDGNSNDIDRYPSRLIDETAPVISSPPDVSPIDLLVDAYVTCQIQDDFLDEYEIHVDNSQVTGGRCFSNSVSINLQALLGLSSGSHEIKIIVIDAVGNVAEDIVIVGIGGDLPGLSMLIPIIGVVGGVIVVAVIVILVRKKGDDIDSINH